MVRCNGQEPLNAKVPLENLGGDYRGLPWRELSPLTCITDEFKTPQDSEINVPFHENMPRATQVPLYNQGLLKIKSPEEDSYCGQGSIYGTSTAESASDCVVPGGGIGAIENMVDNSIFTVDYPKPSVGEEVDEWNADDYPLPRRVEATRINELKRDQEWPSVFMPGYQSFDEAYPLAIPGGNVQKSVKVKPRQMCRVCGKTYASKSSLKVRRDCLLF